MAAHTAIARQLVRIVQGDFREVAESLGDASVDFIFTDPPYDKDSLPLFGDLARVAARVLKPGASVITYTSEMFIPQICALMAPHLKFHWTLTVKYDRGVRMRYYDVNVKSKILLWFTNGSHGPNKVVASLIPSAPEKGLHPHSRTRRSGPKRSRMSLTLSRHTATTLSTIASSNATSKAFPDGVSASKMISWIRLRHGDRPTAGFGILIPLRHDPTRSMSRSRSMRDPGGGQWPGQS